ncbi:MAG: AAC(3) family N-acetyltransferase [Prevotella sp.]|nr:AAC(3) family N-acetyltransferase [Prevotella sp.]
MKVSFYTQLGIIIKKLTGIQDISLVRKNIKKNIGKHIYNKKYTPQDIINTMALLGVKPGGVVCIHASMKEFYNYQGTAKELIDAIINYLTPEGTLMMPAMPFTDLRDINLDNYIFNPKTDKTAAGYLAETFRQYPNVVRSINVQHSVCAFGKHAKWLTKDHHLGNNCWDEYSPYYRMVQLGGIVVNLGMPSFYIGTFDHCVEAILYKEHPYWQQFFNKLQSYRYYNDQGEVKQYTCLTGDLECRTREKRLTKYFSPDIHKKKRLSNLLITMYDAKPCLEKMLELGRHGITMYYVPSPQKYKF